MLILDPSRPVTEQCPKFLARCRAHLGDLGDPRGYSITAVADDVGMFRPALVHVVVGDPAIDEPEGLDITEPYDAPTTGVRLGNAQLVADNMAAELARGLGLEPMSAFEAQAE